MPAQQERCTVRSVYTSKQPGVQGAASFPHSTKADFHHAQAGVNTTIVAPPASLHTHTNTYLQATQRHGLYRDHPEPCGRHQWLALQLPLEKLLHNRRRRCTLLLLLLLLFLLCCGWRSVLAGAAGSLLCRKFGTWWWGARPAGCLPPCGCCQVVQQQLTALHKHYNRAGVFVACDGSLCRWYNKQNTSYCEVEFVSAGVAAHTQPCWIKHTDRHTNRQTVSSSCQHRTEVCAPPS